MVLQWLMGEAKVGAAQWVNRQGPLKKDARAAQPPNKALFNGAGPETVIVPDVCMMTLVRDRQSAILNRH